MKRLIVLIGLLMLALPHSEIVAQSDFSQGCGMRVTHLARQDTSLPLFPTFQACCEEQDHFQFHLEGFRLNLASLLAKTKSNRYRTRAFMMLTEVRTPSGSFQRFILPDGFFLTHDAQPGRAADDSIFSFTNPSLALSPVLLAEPGNYDLEVTIYGLGKKLADDFDHGVLTIPPTWHTQVNEDAELKELMSQWLANHQIRPEIISFQIGHQISHPMDDSRESQQQLLAGYRVHFQECPDQAYPTLYLDQEGNARDQNYNLIEESYVVVSALRKPGPVISESARMLEYTRELNQLKLNGLATWKKLNEAMLYLDGLDGFSDFDKYVYKLELFDLFGNLSDLNKLLLPSSSTLDIISKDLNKREELACLWARKAMCEGNLIHPGAKLHEEEWATAVKALTNAQIWPIAKRFMECDVKRTRLYILALGAPGLFDQSDAPPLESEL